jgi:CRISPR/Cas system-associated exonuclease Cas4 (RecB family)
MTFPNVVASVIKAKEKKRKIHPCHTNRASEIGHECEKYLVLNRTRWQEKLMYSVELQFIFDHGKYIEKEAIDELEAGGNEVIEQQRPFEIEGKGARITGHIDSRVRLKSDGNIYTCEIKGLSPFDWQKLHTIDDFFNSTKPWIKKYPAQLNSYMRGTDTSPGFFYIKNKMAPNMPKVIWMSFDSTYMTELFEKAKRVDDHVKNGTFPEPVSFCKTCERCSFSHICLPDKNYGEGVEVVNDTELEEMLNRRAELKDAYSEYGKVDKFVKERVKNRPFLTCGEWFIEGKVVKRKGFTVKDSEYWKSNIKKTA